MDDKDRPAARAIRLRSQLGEAALAEVSLRMEEARKLHDNARLRYWREVAHSLLLLNIDPPPALQPDELPSEGEFQRLALALLQEMGLDRPDLAERLDAAGVGLQDQVLQELADEPTS